MTVMEKGSLIKAMKVSISEVLEKMFFLPLDFDDSHASIILSKLENGVLFVAKLDFSGPFTGYCLLFIPKDLASYVTANFLGKEEDHVSEDDVTGTVREIINMITGNSFSAYNSRMVVNLGVPEMVRMDEVMRDLQKSKEAVYVSVNTLKDSCLTLSLVID